MNKELINKYKDAFDHYLQEGSICFKTDIWFTYNPSSHVDPFVLNRQDTVRSVVINDDYVEFRKALAEGKTVQANKSYGAHAANPDLWEGITEKVMKCYNTGFLRIKPDEPKLQVGDWVVMGRNSNKLQWTEEDSKVVARQGVARQGEVTLWEPKKDDWCWFWNEVMLKPEFARLYKIIPEDKAQPYRAYVDSRIAGDDTFKYEHCEPFSGTLPTHLQGQK